MRRPSHTNITIRETDLTDRGDKEDGLRTSNKSEAELTETDYLWKRNEGLVIQTKKDHEDIYEDVLSIEDKLEGLDTKGKREDKTRAIRMNIPKTVSHRH